MVRNPPCGRDVRNRFLLNAAFFPQFSGGPTLLTPVPGHTERAIWAALFAFTFARCSWQVPDPCRDVVGACHQPPTVMNKIASAVNKSIFTDPGRVRVSLLRACCVKMLVGELQEDFPIVLCHGMLAGTDVVTQRAVDQFVGLGHRFGVEAAGA